MSALDKIARPGVCARSMPYAKPTKAHWGPNTGRVICGRKTKARRVKLREEWDAIDKEDRCTLCDEAVQRDGKPRGFNVQGLYGRAPARARARSSRPWRAPVSAVLACSDMASNSIAPSPRALDLYLDGSDWKVALFNAAGSTQIAAAGASTIGAVDVASGSIVTLPLDLRALGGEPANELRIHGAGTIKLQLARPLSDAFPVSAHLVVDGEILGVQLEQLVDIGAGVTRVRISWGG